MPDGDTTQTGQEPTTNSEPAGNGSRSLDSFPEEAQDYIRRLRQEAAGYRNDLKAANTALKEHEDAGKSAQQKLEDRAAAAEGELAKTTTRLLRYEVASEEGIPLNLAGRLQGSTKEELKADADALKKEFGLTSGDGAPGGSGFDGGVRRPVSNKPKGMNGFIRQAAGR